MSGRRSAASLPPLGAHRNGLLCPANATLSLLNGRTEENARYHRVCRAVRDLGLDVSRDPVLN